MTNRAHRSALAAAAAVGLLLGMAPAVTPEVTDVEPASEELPAVVRVPPMGQFFGYLPLYVYQTEGGGVTLTIDDFVPHTITSRQTDEDGYPLFKSGRTEPGATAEVVGVSELPPGEYRFYCSIHTNMPGVLTVLADSGGTDASLE